MRAIDLRSPAGSGIRQVRIDYRDGTIPVVTTAERPIFSHFFRKGTFKVRISAQDGAGNYVVAYRTVKIKAPPKKKKKGKKNKKKAPEPQTPAPETPEPPADEEPTTPTEPSRPASRSPTRAAPASPAGAERAPRHAAIARRAPARMAA